MITIGAFSMAFSSGVSLALRLVLTCGLMLAAFRAASGDKLMMERFLRWRATYNRTYLTQEDVQTRFEVYRRNIERIEATNREGILTHQLGENQFADLTEEEFLAMYAMKGGTTMTADKGNSSFSGLGDAVDAPPSVDWRSKGAVVPPKNQRPSCSSCWAFVTTATIESIVMINTGKLVSLSEQELIDCDLNDGGCNLGYFVRGYKWVIQNGGLTTSVNYPYQARRSDCNRSNASLQAAKIQDYVQVPAGEANLQQAVAQQPVAAAVRMGGDLQFYRGGVFSGKCGTRMNHAVTVVGYGTDASTGLKYWIAKNSWGTAWGEGGYLRMRRDVGDGGMCGIALDLAYPVM